MSMDLNRFLQTFTDIDVTMNWVLLATFNPIISRTNLSDRDKLGEYYTPWRKNGDGSYANGFCASATPLRVKEQQFPTKVETNIEPDVTDCELTMSVPCYALGEHDRLILDKNHRAVSLYRSKKEFDLCIWTIEGPIDRKMLPDLEYWQT